MNSKDFELLRREYMQSALDESEMSEDPFVQFKQWFDQARKEKLDMPNAMTLATVSPEGKPEARIVLLKSFSPDGFTFFTNYASNKAKAIEQRPEVSLLFFWSQFDRQVRIEGEIRKIDEQTSKEYFLTRPLDSQISAIISPQSQMVKSRQALEMAFKTFKDKLKEGETLNKPETWGGYLVSPRRFEFWQGRENRLHDRLVYSFNDDSWEISRLAP